MSSVGAADSTVELIKKAMAAEVHKHPRHFLILCHELQYDAVVLAVVEAKAPDVMVEVKVHKFCEPGKAYLMRHPDDFQSFGKFEFGVGESAAGEAFPPAASA